jgi:hypothetical protein
MSCFDFGFRTNSYQSIEVDIKGIKILYADFNY